MQKDGLQTRSLSKSFALLLQQTAQKVWLEDDPTKPTQRSQGKLGAIEEHLDDIVADVKSNLTAMFNRGAQFDEMAEKSENLKTHVSKKKVTGYGT